MGKRGLRCLISSAVGAGITDSIQTNNKKSGKKISPIRNGIQNSDIKGKASCT